MQSPEGTLTKSPPGDGSGGQSGRRATAAAAGTTGAAARVGL